MTNNEEIEIVQNARELLSSRFQGILATHSIECPGYPFGSLIPYSLDRHGWPLILISHLAKHTRNMTTDPHCNLTISEQDAGDTQTLTRLSCLADAVPVSNIDKRAADRHFRYFPESRIYHEDLNFLFYRLVPVRFYCVAGFGAARWIGVDRMQVDNPFSHSEEEALLADINNRFCGRLIKRLAPTTDADSPLIAVGLDGSGLDLRQNRRLLRLSLHARVNTPPEFLSVLTDCIQSSYFHNP